MTDEILIRNMKTGAIEIKRVGYILPCYDIGDVLAYQASKTKDDGLPPTYNESEVIGIQADIRLLGQEVVSAYIYELEDGTEIMEEEVEYYYDRESLQAAEEDERDPQSGDNDGGAS